MPKAGTITSAANPLIKDVRRAIQRGTLTSQGWAVAESFHLLEEALRGPCEVMAVLAAESVRTSAEGYLEQVPGAQLAVLPDALFQAISGTEASQGVIALVQPPQWTLPQLFHGCPLIVVLDGLQDPGNAGTVVRAAEAFGASGVLFVKGTVSPFNPKTLRASAGSLFRVPFLHGVDPATARAELARSRVDAYVAVPSRPGQPVPSPADIDLTRPSALVIGNEAHGVGGELRMAASEISIPTAGVESLNAAVAAAILLYEARRQRTSRS